ncbi:MAG: rod shape-determining protein MreC [Deltaproteobacteria bacterium]|nr:rod shape-determining protein MreC [Candidatus Anaeroferrophillacea bacterium]
MFSFVKRHQLLFTVCAVFAVSSLLLGLGSREHPFLPRVESLFMAAAFPFQKAADTVVDRTDALIRNYLLLVNVKRENRELRNRVANLEYQLIELAEARRENRELRRLLDFGTSHHLPAQTAIANIIGRSLDGVSRMIFIDRGGRDHLTRHTPAVTPCGIIGQVTAVSPFSAKVMLITDQHSACDVIIQRSRERALLKGANRPLCELHYLPRTTDITVGDTVITSGQDGVYPKGLPVGRVVAVSRDGAEGLGTAATVEPFAHMDQLEEILLAPAAGGRSPHE